MIAEKHKQLYTTVFMALTLAHAAPLHDAATTSQENEVPSTPVIQFGLLDPEHPPPHSAMQVTSTAPKDSIFSRQARLQPVKDAAKDLIPLRKDAKSLAAYVVSLKEYVEKLDEDAFEDFIEHYLKTSTDEEKFALDLALELDDSDSDFDSDDYPLWSEDEEDDDTSIEFVPSLKPKSKDTSALPALQLGKCTKEDFKSGKCVSIHPDKKASATKGPLPPFSKKPIPPRHGIFSHYLSEANAPAIDGFNPGENRTGSSSKNYWSGEDILNPVIQTSKPVEVMLSSDGVTPDAKGKTLVIIPTVTKRGLFSFV